MWSVSETIQSAIALLIIMFFLSIGALGASFTESESLKMGKSRKNRGRRQAAKKEKEEVMEVIEHGHQFIHPRVVLDQTAYHKIMHWVQKADGEISGLGKIEPQEDGTFRVTNVMLLPQKNTGASTELDGPAVAKAMYELKDVPGHLNYWWHSHVNMPAFWSKTDTDTMKEFADAGGNGGWCVATVFNKKRETKSAFCMAAPFQTPIRVLIDDIPMDVTAFLNPEVFKTWDAEYEKNCKKAPPVVTNNIGYPHYKGRTVWDNPPTEMDTRDGWCNRYDFRAQGFRRIPVNEYGEFSTRDTFEEGEKIPVSFYFDPTITWMGGKLRQTPHPDHPKMKVVQGNENVLQLPTSKELKEADIEKIREELVRCTNYAELIALESKLDEAGQDALWRMPEVDRILHGSAMSGDWGDTRGMGYN